VFDSRLPGNAPVLSSGVPRTVAVAGLCGVPAGASSVAVNLTVTGPTSAGFLRLSPTGPAPGPFSLLNYSAGQTRGNNAIVQLSAGGSLDALATMPTAGTLHLILDVFGYFRDDTPPIAVDDSAIVNEDSPPTTMDVLANDTDPDAGPIAVGSVTQPANGTVVITSGGADLTYEPDPDYCNAPPGTTPDPVTYSLSPGGSTATVSLTVTCVNDAPVLAGPGTVSFTENGPPVTVAPALTAQDVDDTSLESATVTITNLLDAGAEILAADTTGTAITAAYATPTLSLMGTAALASYELVLGRVTYENTSANPSTPSRALAFVANDGNLASNTEVATVLVNSGNDAPVLTPGGGSPTFTEDGSPGAIDPGLAVTDADDTNLESATVTITNLLNAGAEVLAATTGGTAITASYVAPTLTLLGADTLANYQAVLRTVAYFNSSQNPSPTARIVAFRVNDGTANSNLLNTSVSVVPVNDSPVLTPGGGSPTFTEGGPPAVLDPVLAVADPDNPNMAFANVTITNLLDAGQETLAASTAGTSVVAVFISPTLVLSGSDTVANYQTVLRTVNYSNSSSNPNTTARSISFVANDGTLPSNTVVKSLTVVAANDAPTLTAGGGSPTYTEDRAAVAVDPALDRVPSERRHR
jgi:hypothetical protein